MSIAENLARVRERIANTAGRTGANPDEIALIAVTKTVDVPTIEEAIRAGVTDIGENYVQDAARKFETLGQSVRWHMIGHLQRSNVRHAVPIFDMIQGVDGIRIAREIGRRASASGKTINILIEVNISGEESKHGVSPEQALSLCAEISEVQGLDLSGLMGIAPFVNDESIIRRSFASLRRLWDELPERHRRWLSMGMSSDFEIAIEEGSNMVRVGSAIFGPRS